MSSTLSSQNLEITKNNYYDYHNLIEGTSITTNWLRRNEAIPIIIEQLNKYGFEHNYEYVMYSIDSNKYLVLDVYSRKEKIGFLFNTGHSASPDIKHRNIKQYEFVNYDSYGKMYRHKYDSLPENLYVLNENCYWFQYCKTIDEENEGVSKSKIIEIFRSDIQEILSKYKDLKKALKKKIVGEIIVEYIVNKKGEVEDVKLIQGGVKLLENEAMRVIKNMPNWKPAMQKGKPISVKYTQKFVFKI